MAGENNVKLVCEIVVNGEARVSVLTTANNIDLGAFVKNIRPGVGKPFFVFNSIPAGTVVAADFTTAPIVSTDVAANNAAIADMLANPPNVSEVLVYA